MHLVQPKVRELALLGVVVAIPRRLRFQLHLEVIGSSPIEDVCATDHLPTPVHLRAQDRVRRLALQVHPNVDPPPARKRRLEDLAVLAMNRRDGIKPHAPLSCVLQLIRGVRVQSRVIVRDTLLLALDCQVNVGKDLMVLPPPCDEVHEEGPNLGAPRLAAQMQHARRKVEPDGAPARMPGAVAAYHSGGVAEGDGLQAAQIWGPRVLDHHGNVARHHQGAEQQEDAWPILRVGLHIHQDEQQVVQRRGPPVRKLQL
mmetsp:Transcript_122041/g.352671  ORF Transcript_122041/g.352671 Transcript_122041/m.352671 type:complete len:257 (-) Transcript_122041:862-1632(-)